MPDQQEVILRIHCRSLPGRRFEERTKVRLGIQNGKVVVEDVLADADSVTFMVPLRVARNPKNGFPNFLGPFAQGTPEARFVYLCWGERVGEAWNPFRRAKVSLKPLDWEQVQKSWATGDPVEIMVNMTDEKGGPVCGSVTASC
jgi:hypothetical protein